MEKCAHCDKSATWKVSGAWGPTITRRQYLCDSCYAIFNEGIEYIANFDKKIEQKAPHAFDSAMVVSYTSEKMPPQ